MSRVRLGLRCPAQYLTPERIRRAVHHTFEGPCSYDPTRRRVRLDVNDSLFDGGFLDRPGREGLPRRDGATLHCLTETNPNLRDQCVNKSALFYRFCGMLGQDSAARCKTVRMAFRPARRQNHGRLNSRTVEPPVGY